MRKGKPEEVSPNSQLMAAPGRQRIVINLEQQTRTNTSVGRVRWSRVFALLATVLVVILLILSVGGYLWWRHYQTTATYSLALIVDAAQRNDMATFNRLVNSDKILNSFSSQAANGLNSGFGLPGAILGNQVNRVAPLLPERFRATFREWLADEIKQFSSSFAAKPFIVIALTLPMVAKVTSDKTTARIETNLRGQSMELMMQKEGEIWRLVALKEDGLFTRILEEIRKDLPAASPVDAVEPDKKRRRHRR